LDARPSGARVIWARDAEADPITVFAKLFEAQAESITTFPYRLEGREFLAAHRHTAPLAARIDAGEMIFTFPGEPPDHVRLGPGDSIWLPAELVHEERVTGDEAVSLLVAHVDPFGTEPA
jgi:quercetin dioxygenase-like cupin family protein